MNPGSSPEKPAVEDNIRRTVERTALRKVRRALDALQAEEASERRLRWIVYVIGALLALLLIGFVTSLASP
jgi:CHASE3 domain sensor protein